VSETEPKRPSDSLTFPLEATDRLIADLVPTSREPGRWPAINALRHLNRAWLAREADPEMAVFRSITAEEESATAVFLAVKRLTYSGAEVIKHRDHLHKNALFPFTKAVADFLSGVDTGPVEVELFVELNDPERLLRLRFHYPIPGTNRRLTIVPKAPLHFQLSEGPSEGERRLVDFADQALALAEKHGFKGVTQYLRDRANLRNRLLYAGATGYPSLRGNVEQALAEARSRTFANLLTFIMIDQHPFRQRFVQQAVAAFLRLLNAAPVDVDFE
jgi:hypothetical protein